MLTHLSIQCFNQLSALKFIFIVNHVTSSRIAKAVVLHLWCTQLTSKLIHIDIGECVTNLESCIITFVVYSSAPRLKIVVMGVAMFCCYA